MNNDPKHFYVTLLSTASQRICPDNTHYDFIVDLAQTIDLGNNDRWEVGLSEYACPPPKPGTHQAFDIGQSRALVYCNLITPQFVGGQLVRCLRTVTILSQYCDYKFTNVHYLPVEKSLIRHVHIQIKTADGKSAAFPGGRTPVIVLHFRLIPTW
jgi:hypothetical protein